MGLSCAELHRLGAKLQDQVRSLLKWGNGCTRDHLYRAGWPKAAKFAANQRMAASALYWQLNTQMWDSGRIECWQTRIMLGGSIAQHTGRVCIGMSYDEHGPNCACSRMGAFTKKHRLVGDMICATVWSNVTMKTTFVGYDTSDVALERARNLAEAGLGEWLPSDPRSIP